MDDPFFALPRSVLAAAIPHARHHASSLHAHNESRGSAHHVALRMRRVDPPIANVTPSAKRFIFNVGLPRTGTTSFQMAAESIGLRVIHSWNPPGKTRPEHYRDHWYREHYATFLSGDPTPLAKADALTDSPFYSRAKELRAAYPNSTFVCTTRSAASWVDSMVFGHMLAGGLYFPRLYRLATPYRNTTEARLNLTRVFREHARDECGAVGAAPLDLRDTADTLWRRFCAVVPDGPRRESCDAKRASRAPWPRTHSEVSKGKRTLH